MNMYSLVKYLKWPVVVGFIFASNISMAATAEQDKMCRDFAGAQEACTPPFPDCPDNTSCTRQTVAACGPEGNEDCGLHCCMPDASAAFSANPKNNNAPKK